MTLTRRNALGAALALSAALICPASFAAVTEGTDYVVLETPVASVKAQSSRSSATTVPSATSTPRLSTKPLWECCRIWNSFPSI